MPVVHLRKFLTASSYARLEVNPFKIFQTPKELAIFYELDGAFREIHTNGRKLPVDPFPSWMGYSTGHWEGDTLVVDSAGYNDKTRLPGGHIHSEAMHIQERFTAVTSAIWTWR